MPITDTVGTYSGQMADGYAGQIADASLSDVSSEVVENAAVAFGLAVGRGTADGSCRLGGTGFVGITVADKTRTADQFAIGEVAAVARKGTIWVTADGAVTDTDTVAFTPATGRLCASGVGKTDIANARFLDSGADGALVRVYLG